MANQRDIARFQQGRDAWNAWANECLVQKQILQNLNNWHVDENGEGLNEETRNWMQAASVDFSRHPFPANLDFREFVFPHSANFNSIRVKKGGRIDFSGAIFLSDASFVTVDFPARADFRRAEFHGDAIFRDSTFQSIARFNPARFHKTAGFRRVTFSNNAWFSGTRFEHVVTFSEATFRKSANFSNAVFSGLASFNWAESTGPFSLSETTFKVVPDFTQMSFRAPVRLDHLSVAEAEPFQKTGDKERAALYRGLKKIAIESHDHLREQQFFASELRERRGNDDPKLSPRYVLSFLYEGLSDFGSNMKRPLAWLLGLWLVMAAAYGTAVSIAFRQTCDWSTSWITPELYLSLLHTLPFIGLVRSGRRELALACLYGSEKGYGPGADLLFIAHNLFATVLLFLFLLAVRNHFRIK